MLGSGDTKPNMTIGVTALAYRSVEREADAIRLPFQTRMNFWVGDQRIGSANAEPVCDTPARCLAAQPAHGMIRGTAMLAINR